MRSLNNITHTTPHDQENENQFGIIENSDFFPFDLFPLKVREGNFCVALSLSAAAKSNYLPLEQTDHHHHWSDDSLVLSLLYRVFF